MAKGISSAERRYQDYLRQRGVQTANAYARSLASKRNAEVRRALAVLAEQYSIENWEAAINILINETAYLPDWYRGVIVQSGLPAVSSTAKSLAGSADAVKPYLGTFEERLTDYAVNRAGQEIVSVTGTFKETIQQTIGKAVTEDPNIGVEKLSKRIAKDMGVENGWQARRIAQTEMMNGLAEGGEEAAQFLDIDYTKQWCISGVGNSRETHIMMDGVTVERDGWFQLVDCRMRYPHDTESNPPAGEIINCACSCIRRPK